MSVLLPPSIALRSSHLYLNYTDDSDSSESHLYLNNTDDSDSSEQGAVRFNGASFSSPSAKFEVVTAINTGSGVHIRCRKNRKFLRRKTETSIFISPEAAEVEEDTAKWGCTLFEARVVEAGNTTKVYLFHVQSQYYANAWEASGVRSLRINSTTPNDQGVYDILDLDTMVILPKHVAFKCTDHKYLQVETSSDNKVWPTFTSTDKGSATSWFETTTDGHGRVLIQSFSNKRYLFVQPNDKNWVCALNTDNPTDPNCRFSPVKLDGSTVALKSLGKDKYFCSHTRDAGVDYLKASSISIGNSSRLTIEELVISRRIYNTVFDLENAIIYGNTPKSMATARSTNNSSRDNTVELNLSYKESRSTTWTASHSWMVGVSATASFTVPFIAGTTVTAEGEYSGSYAWGETLTSETTLESTYKATVPPHSSITVTMMATEAKCDVNYSYYQRDELYNGETVIYQKDDGLCTGMNSYNFYYEVKTAEVPDTSIDLKSSEHIEKFGTDSEVPTHRKVRNTSIDPTVKKLLIPLP